MCRGSSFLMTLRAFFKCGIDSVVMPTLDSINPRASSPLYTLYAWAPPQSEEFGLSTSHVDEQHDKSHLPIHAARRVDSLQHLGKSIEIHVTVRGPSSFRAIRLLLGDNWRRETAAPDLSRNVTGYAGLDGLSSTHIRLNLSSNSFPSSCQVWRPYPSLT